MAGDNTCALTNTGAQPVTNQRGKPRPLGAACDIGPVEYGEVMYYTYLPFVTK